LTFLARFDTIAFAPQREMLKNINFKASAQNLENYIEKTRNYAKKEVRFFWKSNSIEFRAR